MESATVPTDVSKAELIRWSFGRLNERDIEALREFWTDDTVERFPDRTCRGADEIAAYFEDTFRAVPDAHIEIVGIAEQNDDVFVQWRLTGTHKGSLLGIEATGKKLEIDGMDHFLIRDGKVVSNFVIIDQLQYARQIGMMPADGSAADKAMKSAFNLRTKVAEKLSG
jgi:steroid delta-isomerase-like uncharacterized protein